VISDESEEEGGIVQKSDQQGNEGSKSTDLEACSSMSTIPSDSGTDKAMIGGSSGISQKSQMPMAGLIVISQLLKSI